MSCSLNVGTFQATIADGYYSDMSTPWEKSLNIAGLGSGIERSILGYAGESLVIGRALVCGYNLFFKAWRDSKYDAVLDHGGNLYRIEIKQTRDAKQVSLTSGGRSGAQISREAESREKVVSTEDCDFLVAVHSLSGKCWVIPTEVIEILGRNSLSVDALEPFSESWAYFSKTPKQFGSLGLRTRLRQLSVAELSQLWSDLSIHGHPSTSYTYGTRGSIQIPGQVDQYAFGIWKHLGESAKL